MRSRPLRTRAWSALPVLALAGGWCRAAAAPPEPPSVQTTRSSQPAAPDEGARRLTEINAALAEQRFALALERIHAAPPPMRETPAFQWRAAQAYFNLGAMLGQSEVRTVPGGRAGRFVDRWLLVELQSEPDRFLCCPPESALYQLRQALDAGLDEPAAHVLHARIWQRLGRPQVGLGILKSRAAILLASPDDAVLKAFADLALDAGALPEYLRYERRRAELHPEQREAILFNACLTAAERYSRAGDEQLYLQWLDRAAHLRPNDVETLLRLADAEWATGRAAQAAPLYRRLLTLSPDHPQRGHILERLADSESRPPRP